MKLIFFLFLLFSFTKQTLAGSESRCQSEEFRCSITGACIDNSKRCDSTYDCDDFSDELNCAQRKACTENEFHCENGYCISNRYVCDMDNDCGDNSDESSCDDNDFSKVGGYRRLMDKEEEEDARSEPTPCGVEFFNCPSTDSCIPYTAVCNGRPDCFDGSDEINCTAMMARSVKQTSNVARNLRGNVGGSGPRGGKFASNRLQQQQQFSSLGGRAGYGFSGPVMGGKGKVNGKLAITNDHRLSSSFMSSSSSSSFFNNNNNDNENNANGDRAFYPTSFNGGDVIDPGPIMGSQCPIGQLLCRSGRQCIEEGKRCDFYADCDDGSDEEYCGSSTDSKRCVESENSFLCENGFCVDRRFTCDSINDCGDMSDEQNCGPDGTFIESSPPPPADALARDADMIRQTSTEVFSSPSAPEVPSPSAPTTTVTMTTTATTKSPKARIDNLASIIAAATRNGNASLTAALSKQKLSQYDSQLLIDALALGTERKATIEKVVPPHSSRTSKLPQQQQHQPQQQKVLLEKTTMSTRTSTPSPSSPPPAYIYSASDQLYTQLACEGDMLALSCPDGYVIGLFSVLFGRDDTTTCIKPLNMMFSSYSAALAAASLNCRANSASDIMKKTCEAKQSCQVRAGISLFGDPCVATPKFLRVRFGCRPIVYASPSSARANLNDVNNEFFLSKRQIAIGKNKGGAGQRYNQQMRSTLTGSDNSLETVSGNGPLKELLKQLSSALLSPNMWSFQQLIRHQQHHNQDETSNDEQQLLAALLFGGADLKAAQWELNPNGCPTQPVREWLHAHVSKWLECHGLGQYKSLFNANDIFGLDLLSIDRSDLERIGVNRIGHQKRLMRAINRLRYLEAQQNYTTDAWSALSSRHHPSHSKAASPYSQFQRHQNRPSLAHYNKMAPSNREFFSSNSRQTQQQSMVMGPILHDDYAISDHKITGNNGQAGSENGEDVASTNEYPSPTSASYMESSLQN